MHVQATAGGAEAADHRGRRIGLEARWDFAEAELSRVQNQLARERAFPLAEQRRDFIGDGFHVGNPPGIFGAATVMKNRKRSANSPASSKVKPTTAASWAEGKTFSMSSSG